MLELLQCVEPSFELSEGDGRPLKELMLEGGSHHGG
jgi:hypothetical protein